MTGHDVHRVYEQVRRTGISAALGLADSYVARAELVLSRLPASPSLASMAELPRSYVTAVVASKVDPRFSLCAS